MGLAMSYLRLPPSLEGRRDPDGIAQLVFGRPDWRRRHPADRIADVGGAWQALHYLITGDPWDDKTQVGPLVSEDAAKRVESWVNEAVAAGAKILTGGTREGATYAPTVLTDVPADAKVAREEVFGPVMFVQPVDGVDEAFALVNDSAFGLQAGIFTRDLDIAFRAHRELDVGGVVIGDVPSYRADQMPYGGMKDSGVGREGLRSAIADYTEEKVMVLTGLPL